ncbi:putative endo-beta-1,4-glucanase D [Halenospora varia]|nr:putative endo-beta-1,4-glucanase D [Halenospora varia]
MKFQTTVPVVALLGIASSHTIFTQLTVGSTTNGIGVGIRIPSYDGPITDVNSNYIACNGGPNPTTASPKVIDVQAGTTVKARWRHTQESTASDVIDAGHKGPVMAYLKKVSNAATDPGYGSGWFKISEAGFTNPSGQYLLRAELIALHGARTSGGAQFYMECAQINITGGTGSKTPATVSLPGAYRATDPGIMLDIYQGLKSYTIPGMLMGNGV